MHLASGEVEHVLRLERVGVRRDGRWILADVDWTVSVATEALAEALARPEA